MLQIEICKAFRKRHSQFCLNIAFELSSSSGISVFFGPSGSGKTLTLQSIAGLAKPDRGLIRLNDDLLYASGQKIFLSPQKRHIGYMLQDYALFPNLTVIQNVAYAKTGLLARIIRKKQHAAALALLQSFGMEHIANHYPSEISGGQKQRAALARALYAGPKLLLLDEPFSALDPLLRMQMRKELMDRLEKLKIPAIIISHDPEDVDVFADGLVLFNSGRAQVVENWQKQRCKFADAGSCLRNLQEEYFGYH